MINNRNQLLRHASIRNTAVTTAFSKAISLLVQILTVKLTIQYLGNDRYGLWMVLTAAVGFLQLTDMGISNALISMIANRKATGKEGELLTITLTATKILVVIAVVIFSLGYILVGLVNWQVVLNIGDSATKAEIRQSILIFLLFFCIGLPLNIAQSIRLGLQQGHKNAGYNIFGQLANISLLIAAMHYQGGLPLLIAASMIGSQLFQLLNLISLLYLFHKKYGFSRFKFANKQLLKDALLFFILQLSALIAFQSDTLIVSHYLTTAAAAEYSVALRYFYIPITMLSIYQSGMWPAYADAFWRDDKSWIVHYFYRNLRVSIFFNSSTSIGMFFCGNYIIDIWTSGAVKPQPELMSGMMCWGILNAFGSNFSTILNALHIVKFQIISSAISSICNVGLSIYLTYKIGVSGPIWGSVIVLCFQNLLTGLFIIRLFNRWKLSDTKPE